ncbi:transglycosylase SLT domain-containing protein [Bradyrhizobium sp. CNPSo 4026]|nr:transglycosylase SLT domain-containing protein [Bradyrhizobium cenepequi]
MLQASASLEAVPPENEATPQQGRPPASPNSDEGELPYLKYYVYSEIPPPEKPAKIALAALSDVPVGTPVQEIERAAEAFGVDANFMKAVAKIESDFNPRERTGSYIGLFQLSNSEFSEYGSGDILNPRDNAMAAAYKFVTEAALFEAITHMELTFANLYLIHQQGWEGAAEHLSHPQRIAWKSMCATQEGLAKGERWCKRAIWGNTMPAVKREWKSVDRLTSGAFVAMWRDRVDTLYARYPAPTLAAAER